MSLWKEKELAAATGGKPTGNWDAEINGVSIDSRTLKRGDLFVALQGVSMDGHQFAKPALERGAGGVIVSKIPEGVAQDAPVLRVADTMKALEDLGAAARKRAKGKIVGITGSVGKTGTKEMLAAVLADQGKGAVHASVKSFNNHWGVPLSLSSLPANAAFGVFEMGMNHAGEIRALTAQVQPHLAIITAIEPVHIEHLKTIEGIADAKAEIFEGMSPQGTAVLNRDSKLFPRLAAAAQAQGIKNIVSYGEEEEADAQLADFSLRSEGSHVTARIGGHTVKYRLNVPGHHIVINSLGVLLAVHCLGGDVEKAAKTIESFEPLAGRGQRSEVVIERGKAPLIVIDETYNASPASMDAALKVLGMSQPKTGGRRIAVLGDMLELGSDGPILHASLAAPVSEAHVDLVLTCGPLMEALHQVIPAAIKGIHCPDSRALAARIREFVHPGDIVVVKGSRGSQMPYIVRALHELSVNAPSASREGDRTHAL